MHVNVFMNEGIGIPSEDWRYHWEQTKLCYENLLKEETVDSAYAFLLQCMNLREHLLTLKTFPSTNINQLFNHNWEMRLCREICEGKARFMMAPEYLIFHFTHIADGCMNRWNRFLESATKAKSKKRAPTKRNEATRILMRL